MAQTHRRGVWAGLPVVIAVAVVTWWRLGRERRPVPMPPPLPPPPMLVAPDAHVTPSASDDEPLLPPLDETKPPGPTSVHADIGEPVEYRWAIAIPSEQGLDVRLLSEPVETCGHHAKAEYGFLMYGPPKGHRLRFVLPPGPGSTYFAGHPIGVDLVDGAKSLRDPVSYGGVQPEVVIFGTHQNLVTIEPFERAKGARVRGKLSFSMKHVAFGEPHGEGTFDAELCDVPNPGADQSASAPKGPVAGKIGPLSFEVRSAVAVISREPDNPYLIGLELSSTPGLGCLDFDKLEDQQRHDTLHVANIGGANKTHLVLHQPQPADASMRSENRDANWFHAARHAWVTFDAFSFEAGKKIQGTLFASSWPGDVEDGRGEVGGRFEAIVCP
jgi:hypothetical protein